MSAALDFRPRKGEEEHQALIRQGDEAGDGKAPATCSCLPSALTCERLSVLCSALCLLSTIVWLGTEGRKERDNGEPYGWLNVRVSRETLLYSDDPGVTAGLRLLQSRWNTHCDGKFQLLLQKPAWDADTESGLVMHSNIEAPFPVSIAGAAIAVFLFSITFQVWRCRNYYPNNPHGLYNPESGPDFSRWLEYFFTSPLQILIVSTAFGFATVDSLIGQCGMQAALVLLGYDIEQQVKKVYKRRTTGSVIKPATRFHHILMPAVHDVRLVVYLGFAWVLHNLIWGLPYAAQNGIGGKYSLMQQQIDQCDITGEIPWPVILIFYLQYVMFTVFGCVSTVQVVWALNAENLTKEDIKAKWLCYSGVYSFLSLSAKTLLEVGLAGYVYTYSPWTLERQWQTELQTWPDDNSTCWALSPSPLDKT